MKYLIVMLICGLVALPVMAGLEEAQAAMAREDYQTAFEELKKLAEAGDDIAMVTIGLFFHQGNGFSQDYSKAMDWYIRAFEKGNGDAYNNIGVMYRDGLGVPVNKRIAYSLFLITHMRGLGSEETQYRAGSNLSRLIRELPEAEMQAALCYTEEYIEAFVKTRGEASPKDPAYQAGPGRPAFKDNNLWLEPERKLLNFTCSESGTP